MYKVFDSEGYFLKAFKSWALAHQWRCLMGRPDWKIYKL